MFSKFLYYSIMASEEKEGAAGGAGVVSSPPRFKHAEPQLQEAPPPTAGTDLGLEETLDRLCLMDGSSVSLSVNYSSNSAVGVKSSIIDHGICLLWSYPTSNCCCLR